MRTAILSDIHGNWHALTAVLEVIDASGVDRIVCLGDIVGYGADPAPCLETVRQRAPITVVGNHDRAAAGLDSLLSMNDVAAAALRWTRDRLSDDDATFLGALPYTVVEAQAGEGEVLFVHGSPERPSEFHYIFEAYDASRALGHTEASLVFVGHSHRAFAFDPEQGEVAAGEGPVALEAGHRYLVNVGSVGQPRDGDARAAFALLDTDQRTVALVRAEYDFIGAAERIIGEGLPRTLANRLATGH